MAVLPNIPHIASGKAILVIATREDLMLARGALWLCAKMVRAVGPARVTRRESQCENDRTSSSGATAIVCRATSCPRERLRNAADAL
jgi:hypothetical protein